jgi:hypothetical protein
MTVEKLNPRDAWLVDRSGKSCCYLVKDIGYIYGLLEKEPGRGMPWKAFLGVGKESKYLGSSYTGKDAAVDMVMQGVRDRQEARR